MGGPAREKAIAELKAEKNGFYGLEDPGPNADLLQELGITIPRPPVRYIMSAAAQAAKRDDCSDRSAPPPSGLTAICVARALVVGVHRPGQTRKLALLPMMRQPGYAQILLARQLPDGTASRECRFDLKMRAVFVIGRRSRLSLPATTHLQTK